MFQKVIIVVILLDGSIPLPPLSLSASTATPDYTTKGREGFVEA